MITKTHMRSSLSQSNMQLVTGKKLQLQHPCVGIACHQGDLYITSGTALCKYTMSGKQVSKMYENTSGSFTVWKCTMSPTGDKLYLTNFSQCKLLTLARDGTLLATFTDSELQHPDGLHVTPAGQVLVCGVLSNTILQVNCMGRDKLATLATRDDKMVYPQSVCYNRHTASIMVGLDWYHYPVVI
ncbi:uncharacterized protein LOC127837496 [Dreissena polymorpha]|uniref:uncharacterized protein LOC127837496 n=1 Tax=Dreissena polymorpha TaxID=45954 RepID=UPI002263C9F8|nr:uncharacterized protein LOC127837496 [Dreissena polymorpha]XP_052220600.1 uncharacterized protein LOC127837496 [Dreissena polymorpha]